MKKPKSIKKKILITILTAASICHCVYADEVKMLLYENFMKNIEEQQQLIEKNPVWEIQDETDVLKMENNTVEISNAKQPDKQILKQTVVPKSLSELPEYQFVKLIPHKEYKEFYNALDIDNDIRNLWRENYKKSEGYKKAEKFWNEYYKDYETNLNIDLKLWHEFFAKNTIDYSDVELCSDIYLALKILLNRYDGQKGYSESYSRVLSDMASSSYGDICSSVEWRVILLSQNVDFEHLSDTDKDSYMNLLNKYADTSDVEYLKEIVEIPEFDVILFSGLYKLYNLSEIKEYYRYLKELYPTHFLSCARSLYIFERIQNFQSSKVKAL